MNQYYWTVRYNGLNGVSTEILCDTPPAYDKNYNWFECVTFMGRVVSIKPWEINEIIAPTAAPGLS